MEKIDFRKQNIPFTQVANGVLNDDRLSLKAKGLYAYLYSKPEGWQFESSRIAMDSKDSRDSVRSALNELEENGYLTRYKLSNGRMVYMVIFPPITQEKPMTENPSEGIEPMTEKANDGKSHSGETRHLSNKDIYINKDIIINKETHEVKKTFSEFQNVKLTDFEFEKLVIRFGEKNTTILIEELGGYLASTGKRYHSHYATLLNWGRRKVQNHQEKLQGKQRTIATM